MLASTRFGPKGQVGNLTTTERPNSFVIARPRVETEVFDAVVSDHR